MRCWCTNPLLYRSKAMCSDPNVTVSCDLSFRRAAFLQARCWDPSFFATAPVPQQPGEQGEAQKRATCAAVEARAQVRLARKYDHLKAKKRLYPDQLKLVSKLHDGTLEKEAARLTMISGHGTFKRRDGTSVSIGGSTGGFTRAVLCDWTPPNLDGEFQ